ncbi:hypothetical protein PG988_016251 [Apiospora saccharicola]
MSRSSRRLASASSTRLQKNGLLRKYVEHNQHGASILSFSADPEKQTCGLVVWGCLASSRIQPSQFTPSVPKSSQRGLGPIAAGHGQMKADEIDEVLGATPRHLAGRHVINMGKLTKTLTNSRVGGSNRAGTPLYRVVTLPPETENPIAEWGYREVQAGKPVRDVREEACEVEGEEDLTPPLPGPKPRHQHPIP